MKVRKWGIFDLDELKQLRALYTHRWRAERACEVLNDDLRYIIQEEALVKIRKGELDHEFEEFCRAVGKTCAKHRGGEGLYLHSTPRGWIIEQALESCVARPYGIIPLTKKEMWSSLWLARRVLQDYKELTEDKE